MKLQENIKLNEKTFKVRVMGIKSNRGFVLQS